MNTFKFLLTIIFLTISLSTSAQYYGYDRPPVSSKKIQEYQKSYLKKSLDSLQKTYYESRNELSEQTARSIEEYLRIDRSITWPRASKAERKNIEERYIQSDNECFKRINSDKEAFKLNQARKAKEELSQKKEDSIRIAKEYQNEKTYYDFVNSSLEKFKIKYRDYVIKCYRENRFNNYSKYDIKAEIDKEYENKYNMNALGNSEKFSVETIKEVMTVIENEFKNSKEYKDAEAKKNEKLRSFTEELNKAQKAYNYNMTHLEQYSTPKLREMYMYFKDKKAFQTEAELIRIELLRRK